MAMETECLALFHSLKPEKRHDLMQSTKEYNIITYGGVRCFQYALLGM